MKYHVLAVVAVISLICADPLRSEVCTDYADDDAAFDACVLKNKSKPKIEKTAKNASLGKKSGSDFFGRERPIDFSEKLVRMRLNGVDKVKIKAQACNYFKDIKSAGAVSSFCSSVKSKFYAQCIEGKDETKEAQDCNYSSGLQSQACSRIWGACREGIISVTP